MKKSRYTEEQIIGILKQHEAGVKTADLCREHGISAATAPAVFSDHRFERLAVKTQLRHQQLQTAVLVFHCPEPLRFADLHPAVLRLPPIECCRADPML